MISHAQPVATPVSPDLEYLQAHLAQLHSTNAPPEPAFETTLATRPVGFCTKDGHPPKDQEVERPDQPIQIAAQPLVSSTVSGPGTEGTGAGVDQMEYELAFRSTPLDMYTAPFAATALLRTAWALIGPTTHWSKSSLGMNVHRAAAASTALVVFLHGKQAFARQRMPRAAIQNRSQQSSFQTDIFPFSAIGWKAPTTLIEALVRIHHAATSTYPSEAK